MSIVAEETWDAIGVEGLPPEKIGKIDDIALVELDPDTDEVVTGHNEADFPVSLPLGCYVSLSPRITNLSSITQSFTTRIYIYDPDGESVLGAIFSDYFSPGQHRYYGGGPVTLDKAGTYTAKITLGDPLIATWEKAIAHVSVAPPPPPPEPFWKWVAIGLGALGALLMIPKKKKRKP